MSIFFWKKKKTTSEPEAAQEPVAAASTEEHVTEEPAAEEISEDEPAEEETSEEETAEEETSEDEPVEEELSEEEPLEEEPSEEEPSEDEPAEEELPQEESVEEAVPVSEEEPATEEPESEEVPEGEPAAEEPDEGLVAVPAEEPVSESTEDTADFPVEETAAILEAESETVGDAIDISVEEDEALPEEESADDAAEDTAVTPVGETKAESDAVSASESKPAAQSEEDTDDDDETERKPRRKSRALLWIFLLVLVIGGCYYYGMVYSRTHFLENTYINGQDVSNMTAPQVEKILSQKADGYELRITFRDGETETITGSQIGFKVKPDGTVDRILQSQDHKKWYMCFFRRTDGEVEQKTTYDPNRLREAVNALPELQKDHMVAPSDAYIELQGTKFSIIPEVEGNYVEIELVQKAADEAVRKEASDVVVTDIEGSYRVPSVRATDEDIVEKCDSYNQMLAGSITWDLPNGDTMTVDKETTVNWLSQDEDGSYYRDEDLWEEKIEFWVDELARNVNTVGRDWSFDATGVGEITVSGGDYGYSVNKIDEREEVWDILWDGETEEREPYFYTTQYNEGSGIGDTYIEANLSQQHVWIYIDGVMVCDTPCVSGNVNNGHGTPTGVYQILYKDTDTDLKGQQLANGQYSYISHVDYWMPFYGGCGFHDASWRSSFGGNIYKYDGSHGCINLPPSITPTFFSYVKKGMPVLVFY